MDIPLHAPNVDPRDALHTYDTEAMIPVKVGEPSLKKQFFDLSLNQESLSIGLDLLNKLRDKSKIHETACKLQAAKRYNTKVQLRSFQKGDLVWRMRSKARKNDDKFSSPFRSERLQLGGVLLRMGFGKICTKDVECHAP